MTTLIEVKGAIYQAVAETGGEFRAPIRQGGSNILQLDEAGEKYMEGVLNNAKQTARNRLGKFWGADGRTGRKGGHDYTEPQIRAIFDEMIASAQTPNGRRNYAQAGLSVEVFNRAQAILFDSGNKVP